MIKMAEDLSFNDIIKNTLFVFDKFNQRQQKKWTIESSIIELSKQVGDLSKRVMMYEKYYLSDREESPFYKTGKKEIGDELSDILYCVIIIAYLYKINLQQAHIQALREALVDLDENIPF